MSDKKLSDKDNSKIKPLTLVISRDHWNNFKSVCTKDKTLNDRIVELILEYTKKRNVK